MIELLLMLLTLMCSWQAIHAKALMTAALWLAGTNALVALTIYGVGAAETAVIELSVGAGLVTILFVFAITIAGDEAMTAPALIPRLLRCLLFIGLVLALGWFIRPVDQVNRLEVEQPFTAVLWQTRGLDVLVQIGLIFAGVMGILGLLAEEKAPETISQTQPTIPPLSPAPPLPRPSAKEKLA